MYNVQNEGTDNDSYVEFIYYGMVIRCKRSELAETIKKLNED